MKGLISQARKLNDFRNDVIHWRAVRDSATGEFPILSSARDINKKAQEMNHLGTEFFARALNLRDDDRTITFVGNHDKLRAQSAGAS
jgi:hypothetical protein